MRSNFVIARANTKKNDNFHVHRVNPSHNDPNIEIRTKISKIQRKIRKFELLKLWLERKTDNQLMDNLLGH